MEKEGQGQTAAGSFGWCAIDRILSSSTDEPWKTALPGEAGRVNLRNDSNDLANRWFNVLLIGAPVFSCSQLGLCPSWLNMSLEMIILYISSSICAWASGLCLAYSLKVGSWRLSTGAAADVTSRDPVHSNTSEAWRTVSHTLLPITSWLLIDWN